MNTRDFLKQVWPATGNFCIAVPHINQLGKKGYKHSVHDNTTDAYLDARARYREVDIYFGIFTHINQSVYSQKWNRNTPSRKRENMDKAIGHLEQAFEPPMSAADTNLRAMLARLYLATDAQDKAMRTNKMETRS